MEVRNQQRFQTAASSCPRTSCDITFLTKLVRAGNDLVLVSELGGHRRLETTKRYTLPTEKDRERAIAGLSLDD